MQIEVPCLVDRCRLQSHASLQVFTVPIWLHHEANLCDLELALQTLVATVSTRLDVPALWQHTGTEDTAAKLLQGSDTMQAAGVLPHSILSTSDKPIALQAQRANRRKQAARLRSPSSLGDAMDMDSADGAQQGAVAMHGSPVDNQTARPRSPAWCG